ncbi:LamG domain-containing protein [Pontiellaceae bacterium B12219]|nr:LamG domain-containing protein [Pontiellaceae bacterium B12219]
MIGIHPVRVSFFNPSDISEKSVISRISVSVNSFVSSVPFTLIAYDVNGNQIGTQTHSGFYGEDDVGLFMEGMHSVELNGEFCAVQSITYSNDSGEAAEKWEQNFSIDLGTNVVKVIKDPIRPFVYALNKTGGEVLFVDLNRQEVVERLYVGASPNGADIDESGKYLFVGHGGDGSGSTGSFRIEKVDLDSRSSVATYVVPSVVENNSPLRAQNITCGAGDAIYYNAAYTVWNNGLARQMNGATGEDLGALPIIKSPMVLSPSKDRLYGQHRYTPNLGEMGVWQISGNTFSKIDRYSYSPYPYGWDYNNYSISGDGQLLSLGYKLFNANDLDDVKGDFDELIYGLNGDGSVAFGKTAIWDTTTFSDLGEATKITELSFASTVMDFDEGERRLFAFNAEDQTLRVFGEPNPLQVYSIHVVDIEAYEGGEMYPSNVVFALENSGASNVSWSVSAPADLSIIPDHGELASGERVQVIVLPDSSIPVGSYDYTLVFSNLTFGLERERGVGLTVYPAPQAPAAPSGPLPAHDTSLVPVVDVSMELEWEHVNAEDDTGPWNTASIYDVYMGTSPTGLASVASGFTNTVFSPGQLELNTTYYWQVVASNVVGVTPGPVWQFTTWKHGPVDHFEWTVSDADQKIDMPFEVTVRAVDENGVWVSDYSNEVEIVGLEKLSFTDDFEEGGSEGWLSTPGTTQSITITDTISAVGTNSLLLLRGYDKDSEKYYYHDLQGGQPTDVEFYVRAENFYGYGANVQLRDGEGGAFAYFYLGYVDMRFNGWKIYDRYAGNQWYKINFKLDWATRRVECYVNGSYRAGGGFLSNADSVSHISLHNYDKSSTWVDEIRVGQAIPIPLESVPTNSVRLVDGEWSGEVVVGQAAEAALFRATDALGHTGDSDFIAVAGYRGDLSLILPARADEGSGVLAGAGQLVVSSAPATNLTVNLSVDEDGLISTPAQVVIPAAQTNVFFDLQVFDDSLLKGSATTTLHASSHGYRAAEASMFVDDDETATLSLSLPQTTFEGASINGALQLDRAPDRDVVEELLSDNPDKIGSSSVVVPAGQMFASFSLPVIDNAIIDGVQTATIEAFVRNWQSGIASVFVFDNENTQIDLQLPASFLEGDGLVTNAGSATLSGSANMDVHVLLTISDSSELIIPDHVTVKAGQTSGYFDVTVPDDIEMDGVQRVSVQVETPGYVPAVRYVDVRDNEVHHFEVFMTNAEVSVFAPVPVEIVAKTVDGLSLPKVDGPLSLTASGDEGAVPVEPSISSNLMQGISVEPIAFGKVGNNVQLVVDDGMGHSGTSAVFNVVGAVLVLEPALLTNTLVVSGESVTRTMIISNAGNTDLEFDILAPLAPEVPEIGNLIVNGDFEAGNTNFTSAYTYSPTGNYLSKGIYFVGDDSETWDTGLTPTMNDHTSSTGQMLMANGSMTSGAVIWEQEIAVVAGKTYSFSAWTAGLFDQNLPTLEFQVAGSSIGSIATESFTWKEFAAEWTAVSSGTVTVGIVDLVVVPPFFTGNTFAIDDIEFRPVDKSTLDVGLVASYPFSGDANDASGNGHDGAVNGATLTSDRFGNPESAYDFNGSSAYINCGNIINGFSNFTVSAWVNIDRFTASDYMGPWSQQRFSYAVENGNYAFYTATHSSAGFGTSMRWDDGVGLNSRVGHTLPLDEWHLITQTYDGNEVRQYDNGELVNSTETGAHSLSNSWDFLIGKAAGYPGYLSTKYFDGQIDDLRVYDRALTEEEILTEYNFADAAVPMRLAASTEIAIFEEGFENGSFDDWVLLAPSSVTPSISTNSAAEGTLSFSLDGGNGHRNGIYKSLPGLQPDRIEFYVKTASPDVASGYFVVGDGSAFNDTAIFFFISGGNMQVADNSSSVACNPNQWYKITFLIDWATKHFDFLVDNEVKYTNLHFRSSTVDAITRVDLYNNENTTAWWDGIRFIAEEDDGEPPVWLSVNPTSGSLAPGASMPIDVKFDASGMEVGESVEQMLKIVSNDLNSPTNEVPVSMDVLAVCRTYPFSVNKYHARLVQSQS